MEVRRPILGMYQLATGAEQGMQHRDASYSVGTTEFIETPSAHEKGYNTSFGGGTWHAAPRIRQEAAKQDPFS